MIDYRRLILENRRAAAVQRRAKLISNIATIEARLKRSRPVWNDEAESDARENHLDILRKQLADEEQSIAIMSDDLEQSASKHQRVETPE